MSNTDPAPPEVDCTATGFAGVLHPREVPLGGPRAIRVRRTLPQRERSLIGAWCFADHYGPHDVRGGTGMDVPPHPHTGLQTVSWLFSGEVEHREPLAQRGRGGQVLDLRVPHGSTPSRSAMSRSSSRSDAGRRGTPGGVMSLPAHPRSSRNMAASWR